ncbi:MAG TPA: hypothetical protein VMQ56_12155 [Terracidiphilus sp.]|jgi:hypothetical protein|nr:hypothetical protein [Terracidiphilus sp.]
MLMSPVFIGVCAILVDADIEGARRNHAVLSKANPSNREPHLDKPMKRRDDDVGAFCGATRAFIMHELMRKFLSGVCELMVCESRLDASRKNC